MALPTFIAISTVNFFRIGYQLVLTAWLAVDLTGRASSVAYVLLISALVNLIFSPIIGKIIDAVPRKKILIVCGYLGIAAAGLIPLAGSLLFPWADCFPMLAGTVFVATISGMFAGGAMDYFMKVYIPVTERLHQLAALNITTQIALIVGTGLGGFAISWLGFGAGFLVVFFSGIAAAILCGCLLPDLMVIADDVSSALSDKPYVRFLTGPVHYFKYPSLFSIACCSALVFSLGQITNTLLPALINIYLKRSSVSYSSIEAAWSVGAFCISVLLARKVKKSAGRNTDDLLLIAAMAVLLAIMPFLGSFSMLLLAHLILGVGFAFVRIRSETRFLGLCPLHLLGRFRANSLFLTSMIGLIVFSAPIIFTGLSITSLYLLLAGIVLLSAVAIAMIKKEAVAIADRVSPP